jgi:hypothetical protein
MLTYRKIGGLHWIFIGRLRIAWCVRRQGNPNVRAKRVVSVNIPMPPTKSSLQRMERAMNIVQLTDAGNCPEYEWVSRDSCRVLRQSPFSGKWHRATIAVTRKHLANWHEGQLIQNAMPHLTDGEREFLISGITPSEWAESFGEGDD